MKAEEWIKSLTDTSCLNCYKEWEVRIAVTRHSIQHCFSGQSINKVREKAEQLERKQILFTNVYIKIWKILQKIQD